MNNRKVGKSNENGHKTTLNNQNNRISDSEMRLKKPDILSLTITDTSERMKGLSQVQWPTKFWNSAHNSGAEIMTISLFCAFKNLFLFRNS